MGYEQKLIMNSICIRFLFSSKNKSSFLIFNLFSYRKTYAIFPLKLI